MNTIQWIIFDISGVVVPFTLVNPAGYEFGSRFFSQKELEGVFFEKSYKNYMLGLISHEQFVGDYLKKKKLDLSVEEFNEIFIKDVHPMIGMELIFQKLEPRYSLALATNEGKVITKYKVEGSGVMQYISKVIPSYLLRELKPYPDFYKKMLKKLEAQPQECIFIDDKKENVNTAKMMGMEGIEFKSAAQLEQDLIKLGVM